MRATTLALLVAATFHLWDGRVLEVTEWIRHGEEYVVTLRDGSTLVVRQQEVREVATVLGGGVSTAAAAEVDVTAAVVSPAEGPAIDGRPDAVWEQAKPVRFTMSEGSQGTVEVTLRALRSETHLYLLVQWPDKTESLGRLYELTPGGWRPTRGREDRLNIAWEIGGSVKEFAEQGCSVLCHKTEGVMRTRAPGERIDLWYWMAQRTNPVGVADDWVMGDEPGRVNGERTGRRPDAPTGGPFEPNWNEATKRPRFTFKAGVRPGPVLLAKDAVEVSAATRFRVGDRIPRELLAASTGARAGIEARGVFTRGQWTVEFRRPLVTGDGDDVQLTGPGPFYFGVSIHDDAEKDEHAQMGRDVLRLRLP